MEIINLKKLLRYKISNVAIVSAEVTTFMMYYHTTPKLYLKKKKD